MSSNEERKMPCPKCNGLGTVSELLYVELYKIICPRCIGLKQLDWIQMAMGIPKGNYLKGIPGYDALSIIQIIKRYHSPDNYVFEFGGSAYFIKIGFFDKQKSVHDKWRYIVLNNSFPKEYPGTLDMWRD